MAGNNSLLKVNNQIMKLINDDCTGNFELQMHVISFIADLKQKGMHLQDCMKKKAEKRRASKLCPAGLSPAADKAEFVIPEEGCCRRIARSTRAGGSASWRSSSSTVSLGRSPLQRNRLILCRTRAKWSSSGSASRQASPMGSQVSSRILQKDG